MRKLLTTLFHIHFCSSFLHGSLLRTWTSREGSKFEASMFKIQNGAVSLKRENGKMLKLRLDQLSKEDQAYVKNSPFAESKGVLGSSAN